MMIPFTLDGAPHWQRRFPRSVWPAYEDFSVFLRVVWDHLGLPEPTRAQLEVAHRLQYGMDSSELARSSIEDQQLAMEVPREDIIRAFRALGKSYISAAYVIWRLMRNPRDEKILVLSATGSKSKEFVDQVKGILQSMPLVQWLLEGTREGGARLRGSADKFDVTGSSMSQSHSIKAVGIFGQTTGSRATLILADDIEIPANTKTEDARATLISAIRSDFRPITKTEHGFGDIIFLGTPQSEESIYNVLVKEMGYRCFCIPVRYPAPDKIQNYLLTRHETKETINILAPYLVADAEAGLLRHGDETDGRFTSDELNKIQAQGKSHFALQYMLDTSLSDAEKYPLRTGDLMIMAVGSELGPLRVQYGVDSNNRNRVDLPNLGFSGDFLVRPLFVSEEWRPYAGKILWVDPAGRGPDEVTWSILGQQSGIMYLIHLGAHRGEPAEAMKKIALDAMKHDVSLIEVEPNYGQGMWTTALKGVLGKLWKGRKVAVAAPGSWQSALKITFDGCTIQESEWAKGQKEARIIDTLEPVMATHRLVINEEVLKADIQGVLADSSDEQRKYSLIHQLTRITHERGCLAHDDRIECLAGAVAHFQRTIELDQEEAEATLLKEEKDDFIRDHMDRLMDNQASQGRRVGFPRRHQQGGSRLGKYKPGGRDLVLTGPGAFRKILGDS